jgi:ABC-type branched-subunit amino acid transport system ATPase component
MSSSPLLEVQALDAGYGDLQVLYDVHIEVRPGERVLVFGPNGAGKSTLMKAIFGLVSPWRGTIRFAGREITGAPPEQIVALGMSYVPQLDNVFPTLTITENLEIGGILDRRQTKRRIQEMFELFPVLKERRHQMARTLSGGERQMLAMARALMLRPTLLLLDEPSAGLAPLLVAETFRRVVEINETGTSILMVEQNAKQALEIAHRGYVLETGRNRFEGTGSDILANEELGRLYLGGEQE